MARATWGRQSARTLNWNQVKYFGNGDKAEKFGDLVIMAVPFGALKSIASQYKDELKGKSVIDISNPLNFDTWDELVVPAVSSAAQLLQSWLPESKVVKGFNTTIGATLQSGKIGDLPTTVLLVSDHQKALAGSPFAGI